MRYFTWNIVWDDSFYGTTPESSVTIGKLEGGFEYQPTSIVGYGTNNVSIVGLNKWSVVEITQEQALAYAQALNPECYVNNEGKIQAPTLVLNN
jgi:hypothetical protein